MGLGHHLHHGRRSYARLVDDPFAGGSRWFDSHYDSPRGLVRLRLVLERLDAHLPPPPVTILDAGGGTGAFALPLAARGHDVILLDASDEWLSLARDKAAAAGNPLRCVRGRVEDAADLVEPGCEVILCHAVLLYAHDPKGCLEALRAVSTRDGILSLLEKNRDGIAFRPALEGNYREARRLLTERVSRGRLGIDNRAYSVDEWTAMLDRAGWRTIDWAGIRLFSDSAPDDLRPDDMEALLDLERDAGRIDPYRRVARLVHIVARAGAA